MSGRTNLGFWCDACARAEGAGAYLVRLQHVGNLSTHLLLHLLHPSRVRALHTQRGDRGTRRARLRNGVRFFVPRAEGRREGGAHGGDAQGGTAVQRRAGASARCLRGGTHIRSACGGASRGQHARDRRHRVTCPRVQTKVRCCLPRSSGKRTRGEFRAKTADCSFGQPAANYFRETPDADSRARHFEARARGGGGASFPHGPSRFRGARPPRVSADRRVSRKKSPRLRHFRRRNVWS